MDDIGGRRTHSRRLWLTEDPAAPIYKLQNPAGYMTRSKVGQEAPLLFRTCPVVEFNLKFGGVVRIPRQLISRSSHTYIHHADGDNVKIAA